jgi:hypothetical protein
VADGEWCPEKLLCEACYGYNAKLPNPLQIDGPSRQSCGERNASALSERDPKRLMANNWVYHHKYELNLAT